MKTNLIIRVSLTIIFLVMSVSSIFSQKSIFEILERDDLTFKEIQNLAQKFINKQNDSLRRKKIIKHYERWKYERRFHVDDKGYLISPLQEVKTYNLNSRTSSLFATSWAELGPKSHDRTTGWNPGVGRVTSLVVNPSNTQIIYVSSPGGGIWISTNGGSNWSQLTDDNKAYMDIYNLCMDPSNTNTIYAAATGVGVIKSVDAGISWSVTGASSINPKKILVSPTNSNRVYVTSPQGIYESSNGGTTWTLRLSVNKEDIEFKPNNALIMYSSGISSNTTTIHRSTDGGTTWTAIASGITNGNERTLLGVSPHNSNVVYAVQSENMDNFGRLYKSTDAGLTFSTIITGNPSTNTNFFGAEGDRTTAQADYDMAIAVNPTNVNDLSIAGVVVWRSTNGGSSFTQKTKWNIDDATGSFGYNHADVHALEYVGTMLYSGSDGGIYKTNYSGGWTDLSTGLGIKQVYRIANSPTNAIIMGGGSQDNGSIARKSNGSFVDWLGGDGMETIIDPNNPLIMFGTSQNGHIYRTTDGGETKTNYARPAEGNWITPIAWHPTNSNILYGGWDYVYKSTNAGVSWTNISSTITTLGNFDELAIAPSNANYIYASKGDTLWVTSNGGSLWTYYVYPATITDIAVKHNTPGKVWITTTSISQSILLSTNAGATYTNISAGLPSLSGSSVAVDDYNVEGVFVSLSIGVYYKNLNNPNWVLFGTGLPQVTIREIELSKVANKLRVGTYGRGIWEVPICKESITYGAISQNPGTYQVMSLINSQANISNQTHYKAGEKIRLLPPFHAGANEIFTAKIEGCY